jgi:hypothetical protein
MKLNLAKQQALNIINNKIKCRKLRFSKKNYRLVRKSNHPFLVLKGVTEMSFLVLKRISTNFEEN